MTKSLQVKLSTKYLAQGKMHERVVRFYVHQQLLAYTHKWTEVKINERGKATPIQLNVMHPLFRFCRSSIENGVSAACNGSDGPCLLDFQCILHGIVVKNYLAWQKQCDMSNWYPLAGDLMQLGNHNTMAMPFSNHAYVDCEKFDVNFYFVGLFIVACQS